MEDRRSAKRDFSDDTVYYVSLGEFQNKSEIVDLLDRMGVMVSARARWLIGTPAFTLNQKKERIRLRFVDMHDLEIDQKSPLTDILNQASRKNLVPCRPEVAIRLRIELCDQAPRSGLVVTSNMRMPPDETELCELGMFVVLTDMNGTKRLDSICALGRDSWGASDTIFVFEER